MHCFACDIIVSNPAAAYDPPTGRYYCAECFEVTIDEQLRLAGKESGELEDLIIDETYVETPVETIDVVKEEEEDDTNPYF